MFDLRFPPFLILTRGYPISNLYPVTHKCDCVKMAETRDLSPHRCTALLCAILALANLQRTHQEQRLAVAFLLDTSDSIAPSQ